MFNIFKEAYSNLFPNPVFLSNGVVVLDRVVPIDEIFGYWSDNPIEDLMKQDLFEVNNMNCFFDFIEEVEDYGACIEDLVLGGENVGMIGDQIKLIDWGYYNNIKRRVISHI